MRSLADKGPFDQNFDPESLVARALSVIIPGGNVVPKHGLWAHGSTFGHGPSSHSLSPPTATHPLRQECQALVNSANRLQQMSISRQFDQRIAEILGDMPGTAFWAAQNMPQPYRELAALHESQLASLRKAAEVLIPRLIKALATRLTGASGDQLLSQAVAVLLHHVRPYLDGMRLYNAPLAQRRDGNFAAALKSIDFYMHQAYNLYLTGDASGENLKVRPATNHMQVGDLQLSSFGGNGLGVIPGNRGMLPVHLLQVPLDLQDWAVLIMPLLSHEAHHEVFFDWRGMEDQTQQAVQSALREAHSAQRLRLSQDYIKLKGQKLPVLELLVKVFTDCVAEHAGDLQGGICTTGPHYLDAMLQSFPAMMIREGRVEDAQSLIRTGSFYSIQEGENGLTLAFEEHGPDVLRLRLGCSMLARMGFKKDADRLTLLTAWASGWAGGWQPKSTSWQLSGSDDPADTIRIPTVDVNAAAEVVADTLVNAKLQCLEGRSPGDLVQYTQRTDSKVRACAERLMRGDARPPVGEGSIYATTVGAAAIVADKQLQSQGGTNLKALTDTTFAMLAHLQDNPVR